MIVLVGGELEVSAHQSLVQRGAMDQRMPGQSNGHRPFRLLFRSEDNDSIDWCILWADIGRVSHVSCRVMKISDRFDVRGTRLDSAPGKQPNK